MSYLVLARKYRSATFDDVVGQNHVAQTLKRAIETGRVAHAYLFCGTRGVGKTSMARILAKALNCRKHDKPTTEPCGKCNACAAIARGEDIDVIEIDAASNTQVEKTRDLIDDAQYRPAYSRFKIYIIDEVHMLSKASFNALLKTLEEPPEHVKFILATTEPEKVLPTILSRCQRYDFRNISTREIADHLKGICRSENIHADDDALLLIAKAGAGSMRDALSLLDRLLSVGEKQLGVEVIEQMLGMPRNQAIFDLAQSIGEANVKQVLEAADALIGRGLSADTLVVSLADHLRNLLILRTCGAGSNLVEAPGLSIDDLTKQAERFDPILLTQDIAILEELRRQMRFSQAGRALLDATLVRLALAEQFTKLQDLLDRVDGGAAASAPASGIKKKSEPLSPCPQGQDASEPANVAPVSEDDLDGLWTRLLEKLTTRSASLPPLLAGAKLVGIEDGQAVLRYPAEHATFVRMLDRNGRKEAVRDVLRELLRKDVGLTLELDVPPEPPPPAPQAPRARESKRPTQPAAPAVEAPVRITDELKKSLRQSEPLIEALIQQLGGEIVKVE